MQQEGMFDGDTVLVTIEQTSPLTLRFQREPYSAVLSIEARRQEQELLEGIAARVLSSRSLPISAAEAVLPVYARASWRTTYAGRPWQELVMSDRRLRLINGLFLSNRTHHSLVDLFDNQEKHAWEAHDAELLAAIDALQHDMLESRREAAAQEIWNGVAPRASTARVSSSIHAPAKQRSSSQTRSTPSRIMSSRSRNVCATASTTRVSGT
jgi:hypothetical protein